MIRLPLCNNRFIYCISVSIISIELPSNSVVRIYFGIRLKPLCVCVCVLMMMMVFGKRITTYTLPQVELMHVKTFDLFLRNKNC